MAPFSSYLHSASFGYHSAKFLLKVNGDSSERGLVWVLTVIHLTRLQRSLSSFAVVEPSLILNWGWNRAGLHLLMDDSAGKGVIQVNSYSTE